MADGTVEHRWTHDPRFVRARLAELGDDEAVELAEPALLKVGAACVSVCRLDAIVRCPVDTDVGALSLEDRIDQLGGFSVPGGADRQARHRFSSPTHPRCLGFRRRAHGEHGER